MSTETPAPRRPRSGASSLGARLQTVPRFRRRDVVKAFLLAALCAVSALVVVDYNPTPTETLRVGDVAPRTVKSPARFTIQDFKGQQERRQEAKDAVLPVYSQQMLGEMLEARIRNAFTVTRDLVVAAEGANEELDVPASTELFRTQLGVQIPSEDVASLIESGVSEETENLAVQLLSSVSSQPIVQDRQLLPLERRQLTVIETDGQRQNERVVTDLETILTPADARQKISLSYLESGHTGPANDAAARIARALVRPTLTYEHLETERRRQKAAASVPNQSETIKRGAILFRAGDTLTESDLLRYRALQDFKGTHSVWLEVLAISLFLILLFGTLYHYGASYMVGFSRRTRDAAAVGLLLLITVVIARAVVVSSETVAEMIGYDAVASSVWFVVPVAGAAMLVRLLLGTSWALLFSIATAALCGLVMDLQALPMAFFVMSGVAGAGAVEHTRERISVLSAGLYTGLVNAAAVLLIHFLQLFVVESEISLATTMRPVWSMSFAFGGGLISAFLVLGMMPLFEAVGFVTDYRMMELANLNHPLLRQLMLRAPGSYHHSVLVGTLAEAGCEAIGANALQAKVSAYFHDIGKSLKPQYFVENQRDGLNKHNSIDAASSARLIIDHVIDGGRMAKEYGLPKPIIDNIYMHHGDGLLMYFFAKAKEADPSVEESAFRYPGPKPNTREAGVIMLADKVEAATRTIKVPNERNIRAMIAKITTSVLVDGQFDQCPLTFQEIRTVTDTFVSVLLGIYHQRIEYPQTAEVSQATTPEATTSDVIALPANRRTVSGSDYEAVEHLPRRD